MISNNGADIFRYWGEAHVSGSADSGTCSSGMERLFAFPLLSVKEKTDLERADLDRYKNKERERERQRSLKAKMKSIEIPGPESFLRLSSSFSSIFPFDFSTRSCQSSQGLISLPIDLSIDRSRDVEDEYTYIYIYIERYGMEIRFEWRANPARNYLEAGARCN